MNESPNTATQSCYPLTKCTSMHSFFCFSVKISQKEIKETSEPFCRDPLNMYVQAFRTYETIPSSHKMFYPSFNKKLLCILGSPEKKKHTWKTKPNAWGQWSFMNALLPVWLKVKKHSVLNTPNIFRVLVNSNGSAEQYICHGQNWVKAFIWETQRWETQDGETHLKVEGQQALCYIPFPFCFHAIIHLEGQGCLYLQMMKSYFQIKVPVMSSQALGRITLFWRPGGKPGRGLPFPAINTLSAYSTSYISPMHPVNCLLCQIDYANGMNC